MGKKTKILYIIITGNPVDGFEFYGPYISHEHAVMAADGLRGNDGADWWIDSLEEL